MAEESKPKDSADVFVVHGRNILARNALFEFLRSIGLKPKEWSQAVAATGKALPYIGEILDAAFSGAQAVVVLMTPDDMAFLRPTLRSRTDPVFETEPTPQARPNVIFEAGIAMGRHPDRTVIAELGQLRPFSDIGGRHVVRLDGTSERRQDLAECLRRAGCPVDLSGRDWHHAGDFAAALQSLEGTGLIAENRRGEDSAKAALQVYVASEQAASPDGILGVLIAIKLRNASTERLNYYSLEVEYPDALLKPRDYIDHEIEERKTATHRFFRLSINRSGILYKKWLYPEDERIAMCFFLPLSFLTFHDEIMGQKVRARAYVGDSVTSEAEKSILQIVSSLNID